MSALVHDSPDRAVTAIEPLTGSDNFATWKRLMTSYLKARQVWDVVSGDLQRPDCLFKYAKPITADIHPLVEPHLNLMTRAVARCRPETKPGTRSFDIQLRLSRSHSKYLWCPFQGPAVGASRLAIEDQAENPNLSSQFFEGDEVLLAIEAAKAVHMSSSNSYDDPDLEL